MNFDRKSYTEINTDNQIYNELLVQIFIIEKLPYLNNTDFLEYHRIKMGFFSGWLLYGP